MKPPNLDALAVVVAVAVVVARPVAVSVTVVVVPALARALALAAPVAVVPGVTIAVTATATAVTSFLITRNALASKELSGCFSQGAAQPTAITSSRRRAYALPKAASHSHSVLRKWLSRGHSREQGGPPFPSATSLPVSYTRKLTSSSSLASSSSPPRTPLSQGHGTRVAQVGATHSPGGAHPPGGAHSRGQVGGSHSLSHAPR